MILHTNHINVLNYTERNKQILLMLSKGKSYEQVANEICLSTMRVKGILRDLCDANKCLNTRHLLCEMIRMGVIK